MKTFKFSLQALLVLREQQEQSALHEYARTLQARESALSALHAIEEELSSSWAIFHQKLESPTAAAEITQLHTFCQAVDRRRQEQEHLATVARNRAHHAFIQLLVARQARAVLEKYAATERNRYNRAKRRQEQKAMDDLPQRQTALASLLHLSRPTLWN